MLVRPLKMETSYTIKLLCHQPILQGGGWRMRSTKRPWIQSVTSTEWHPSKAGHRSSDELPRLARCVWSHTANCWGSDVLWLQGENRGSFVSVTLLDLNLHVPSFGWVWLVSFCCNKTITLYIVLLWFLWVILANYESERIVGTQFCSQLDRSEGGMGIPEWSASVWSEDSTVEAVPLTWKSGPTSCSWCQTSLRWARQIRCTVPMEGS